MPLCFKATRDLLKTCAAAATLGVALAPSSALAVTTWNWSFTSDTANQSGSGTFTTANVTPTAGTTYQITGITGTYNRGGTAYTITGLNGFDLNQFQWNGTSSSPILTGQYDKISFYAGTSGQYVSISNSLGSGYAPVDDIDTIFAGPDGNITSSSLAPVSPPSTLHRSPRPASPARRRRGLPGQPPPAPSSERFAACGLKGCTPELIRWLHRQPDQRLARRNSPLSLLGDLQLGLERLRHRRRKTARAAAPGGADQDSSASSRNRWRRKTGSNPGGLPPIPATPQGPWFARPCPRPQPGGCRSNARQPSLVLSGVAGDGHGSRRHDPCNPAGQERRPPPPCPLQRCRVSSLV
jgi:hypothetical protein